MRTVKKTAPVLVLAAVMMLGGCRNGDGGGKLTYPKAPPDYPMYDTASIDNESKWNIMNVHDPSILKTDDGYYLYNTDVRVAGTPRAGIMVRKSRDLIHWDWVGYALDGVPKPAGEWTGATGLWAPDVAKLGDKYYLYYAASQFGTNQSFIGVATGASPEGPWTDQGEVIKTAPGDEPNAIDPNIVTDANGDAWMSYGSFFGGIYIVKLDPKTGKPLEPGFGTRIAARDHITEDGAEEGPYIVYNPKLKKYYLFVSYDSLFEDYNVRVGRSDSITGPYVDANGRDMTDTLYAPQSEIGNKILGGYKFGDSDGWVAPGHNSVLKDGDDYYIVHHARGEADKSWPYLHVRKIVWTKDGWPVVSPERYAGEKEQKIPEAKLAGKWERIVIDPAVDGMIPSQPFTLRDNGKLESGSGSGTWKFDGDRSLTLKWKGKDGEKGTVETVVVLPAWDWELKRPTLVFTGMNKQGIAVWGKQISQSGK